MVLTTQCCNFPQWLVDEANCMFVGVNDTYIDFVDNRVLFAIESNIHHVESWGSLLKTWRQCLRGYVGGEKISKMRLIIVARQSNGARMHH